jgi:maleate isomerase
MRKRLRFAMAPKVALSAHDASRLINGRGTFSKWPVTTVRLRTARRRANISPMSRTFRIGQIVPSSNVTMETEIPAMLRAREAIAPDRFTFHSSRMRMRKVAKEELAAMDAESERCAVELSDARVDVLGYACLVAIMSMDHGYHRISEQRLHRRTVENGAPAPVVTSAGALVGGLEALGAKRVAIIAPYMKPLTKLVVEYLENEGIGVADYVTLEIPDNLEVAAQDPMRLVEIYRRLKLNNVDALVLSACVQMPSLAAIPRVEAECGIPVVSAAVCTAWQMLLALGLDTAVPNAGMLLSGKFSKPRTETAA